jgi:hypothetical protein
MRRVVLGALVDLALPAAAAAKSHQLMLAPPGDSGLQQYVETIPTAHAGSRRAPCTKAADRVTLRAAVQALRAEVEGEAARFVFDPAGAGFSGDHRSRCGSLYPGDSTERSSLDHPWKR